MVEGTVVRVEEARKKISESSFGCCCQQKESRHGGRKEGGKNERVYARRGIGQEQGGCCSLYTAQAT
jgi:hypothetical protein